MPERRNPYREALARSGELVYRPTTSGGPTMRVWEYVLFATMVAAAFLLTQSILLAMVVALAWSAVFVWRWRKHARGVRLRVEQGDLFVRLPTKKGTVHVPLHAIEAVELDTRTIERVERDTSIVGQITAGMQVRGPSDESRIVLVLAPPRAPIALTEDRGRYSEAVEWLGKIRVFLRSHGWRPADERDVE